MSLKALILQLGLVGCHCLFSQTLHGQDNPWGFVGENQLTVKNLITPNPFRTVQLDLRRLASILEAAPSWQTDAAAKRQARLALPMPDGSFQSFKIVEAPIMHPALSQKYPTIKAYAGTGTDDPSAYLRFDITPNGFHAMILSAASGDVFIEPSATAGGNEYMVFSKKDFQRNEAWECATPSDNAVRPGLPQGFEKAGDCKMRTYRLALACTGEFAQFHGGTTASALAAMHTTMTRVNAIFERDLSITMQLVANTDLLIFTDPASDPYTNNNGSSMLSQNQTACNDLIGAANYDIGHVFSTGGGGVAYVKSVCNNSLKASGVTGTNQPVGDVFNVDYVAHEMGHQFGANHTQNNNCNRNPPTSVEPGSASTIMGYAGICTPNVQAHSDAYFHAVSLAEIAAFASANGGACATESIHDNGPSANAGADYTIPKSTNFSLTGVGYDSDEADQLTYCWEQMDNQAAVMPPVPANAAGPCFRSFPPSISPTRYFPNLTAVLDNQNPAWEVLPGVGRQLNFRLTVRDNRIGGGCTAEDDVVVNVDGNSGPFLLTSPNTEVQWKGGESQLVSWEVAGTTAAPVGCGHVDILLSLDGGLTFSVTLASATPNDGSQTIVVPNTQTAQARIMVKGAGNIFFDISNSNFSISHTAQFSVNISGHDLNCHGDNSGAAKAYPYGSGSGYTYSWSNGALTQGIAQLAAGTYTVTVTSGGDSATASIVIAEPPLLTVEVSAEQTTFGNKATATAAGGAGGYLFSWSNGANSATIENLGAGVFTVKVSDANGCTATGTTILEGPQPLKFENGAIGSVTNQWQTVHLEHQYSSMVVVASLVVSNNTSPSLVTRIRHASGNSFEIKVQEAGNVDGPVGAVQAYYMVAEEGVYPMEQNGVKFEAKKVISTKTSRAANWQYEPQTYTQPYHHPVVLGQVMTYNDPNWSVFWASMADARYKAPTYNSLSVGKHIGEASQNLDRTDETLGYMVFETGPGFINGKRFATAVGSDIVRGFGNSDDGYGYALNGFTSVEGAIVSSAGMDGSEGAWAVLRGPTPTANSLKVYALEDQTRDEERSHTTEQVAFIVFGDGPGLKPESADGSDQALGKPAPDIYMTAFPNPATEEVTVEFEQKTLGGPALALYDLPGRAVYQNSLVIAEPGIRQVKINVGHLKPGYYFLKLQDGGTPKLLKLVIAQR